MKKEPLYLSKITETIFLLYRRLHNNKKQIKDLQTKQDNNLFISYFEEKIKNEKYITTLYIMIIFSNLLNLYMDINYDNSHFDFIDLILLITLGLVILTNLKITKYSKSWSDSYSNLSHWNQFFANYEITPKKKELNLLERDFQQFEINNPNQKIKCPICGIFNDPFSNYCDNCGNELKNMGDKN